MTTAFRRLLTLAMLLPSIGQAQQKLLAHVGDRVRITAPESGFELITGSVVASDSALLTIRVPATRGFYYVHSGQIEAIDISANSRTGLFGGMAVGAMNGIIAGIGIGAMQSTNNLGKLNFGPERRDAMLLGAAGAIVGGLVGLLIRSDDWVPVTMESPAKSKPPVAAAVGLSGITLRWSVSY